jgi:hypothetical protein
MRKTVLHPRGRYNMIPGLLGEGALTLWLLVMGVNVQRWKEQGGVTMTI